MHIEASLGRRPRAAWRLGDYGQGASAAVLAEAWAVVRLEELEVGGWECCRWVWDHEVLLRRRGGEAAAGELRA